MDFLNTHLNSDINMHGKYLSNLFYFLQQSIPESLTARLLNVVVLDVHSNELKSLPNSIGCLSKLKVLNVSGNHLQSLPRTIENCRCFILHFFYLPTLLSILYLCVMSSAFSGHIRGSFLLICCFIC